uniref:Reverse transcriptase zinc-binding domain-containing protein n=1 Tax=Glycine max TaxID=3847 RepID=A0A0R0GXY0_SOYBN
MVVPKRNKERTIIRCRFMDPYKYFSNDMCSTCDSCSEIDAKLFLHCTAANYIWNRLFGIFCDTRCVLLA